MTQICTIQELYALIPETKDLEGAQYQDNRHLMTSVIQAIEKSGFWEFVQYIQGNPSLFVVREEIRKEFKEIKEVAKVMKSTSPVFTSTRKTEKPTIIERVAAKQEIVENFQTLEGNHGIIPSVSTPTKYPWQK